MKKMLGAALALLSFAVLAQEPVIAPPLSGEEAAVVGEMKRQWEESGMPQMTDGR